MIQHGAPFNLGIHRYRGGVYSPNGHKYIREFDCESVPRMTYRVGGVILTKEKIFISEENRILIRYTLVEAHSPTTLRFRPFLAFREANSLCVANDSVNRAIEPVTNGIATCMYAGFPTLYMQFNHKAQWVDQPNWYNGIEYVKDLERGVPYCEDLWVPGYFEVPIKQGESLIFSAGVSEVNPRNLSKMYSAEVASRTPRTSFFNCLKNSAKQFYIRRGESMYLISGFPWGIVLARNTFMALPGLTLAIDHRADFETIMATALKALTRFADTGQVSDKIHGIEHPDIPLWALWAIQQYAKSTGTEACRQRYARSVASLVDYVLEGRHPNLYVDADTGLLSTDGHLHPVSWMNSQLGGMPVVRRTGKLVEFNALWYNALMFAASLIENDSSLASARERWLAQAEKMKQPFIDTFLNESGYLYDYVDGTFAEPSVRPNMAIAIGLDYSPLRLPPQLPRKPRRTRVRHAQRTGAPMADRLLCRRLSARVRRKRCGIYRPHANRLRGRHVAGLHRLPLAALRRQPAIHRSRSRFPRHERGRGAPCIPDTQTARTINPKLPTSKT